MKKDWSRPSEVSDATLAFPAHVVGTLLPEWDEIPDDFKNLTDGSRKWINFQRDWMFWGLTEVQVALKEGVDGNTAWRHLSAVQGSFEPKHEHKEAGFAWLASLWFDDIAYKKKARG